MKLKTGNRWLCGAALATAIQNNGSRASAAGLGEHGRSQYSPAYLRWGEPQKNEG